MSGNNGSWGGSGWGNAEPPKKDGSGGSGRGPRGFWMPVGATKRVIFLDGEPFTFFEHGLYHITGNAEDKTVCLGRNKLDERGCPLCPTKEDEASKAAGGDGKLKGPRQYPAMVGYFTVIDCGDVSVDGLGNAVCKGWTTDKGVTYQFDRKLYGAKRGSEDKPGTLPKLNRLAQKYCRGGGDISLSGSVWDIYRSGKQSPSVGDEFTFIKTLRRNEIAAYVKELGGTEIQLKKLADSGWKGFNYMDVFKPPTYDELLRMTSGGAGQGEARGDSGGWGSGNSFDGPSGGEQAPSGGSPGLPITDDDIPF